jgi:hypothetical protein
MDVTGDTKPVLYLVEKFLAKVNPAEIERQIQALQEKLAASKAG